MAEKVSIKQKAVSLIDTVRYNWSEPPKGRYMTYKEILSYAGGGIGAYFIITMGAQLLVSTTNMIVGGAIGVAALDMYVLYLISTLANIPLTAVRANMVDNTRGKQGKYRPYLLSMGIPTTIIALAYVYFPYEKLKDIFTGELFGKKTSYIVLCAVVLVFNLLLQFFYNFFMDAYTNLIHVLSPNTQERTDVLSIKSVVYSLAPSIMNLVLPIIAQLATDNDLYDIRVYRIAYPAFAIFGIGLTIIVYANTQEKIVQAKTHTIQVSFIDSFKAVAKNKYFWIISMAGWLGFLETAYSNILTWSYNYGHTAEGGTFALIQTLTGNAALWGMLFAPFFIRKFGKKKVLIFVNMMNVACILAMYINMRSIWWLFICVYFNMMVGSVEQITGPAIQADIRDHQQWISGERIDGMFATVVTIGNVVTLLTSSVLPAVQQHYGIVEGNGYEKPFDILDVKTGQPGLLYTMMGALILMAGVGAFLNVVPYFFYDLTEKKQKSIVKVLQLRALFEDYGNNALKNSQIVEAIDMVENAKKMSAAQPKEAKKSMYQSISDKAAKKAAKKQYKENLAFNEEIEISQFVMKEFNKFDSEFGRHQVATCKKIYDAGLDSIKNYNIDSLKAQLAQAKNMPKETEEHKEERKFEIETIHKMISAKKAYDKYYGTVHEFIAPEMSALTALFDKEDAYDEKIVELVKEKSIAKKAKDNVEVDKISAEIKNLQKALKECRKQSKEMQDEFAKFNRAAKPYNDAKKLLTQEENFSHFDEIAALYDEAKAKAEEEERIKDAETAKKRAEEEAELAKRKAEKAAKKAAKKNK